MQVETYRRGALALLCLSIFAVVFLTGCSGGSSSTTAAGPVADAGRFRSCVERELGTYPTPGPHFLAKTNPLTGFGVTGSTLGEAGASVSLLHGNPDAFVWETAEEAEVAGKEAEKAEPKVIVITDGNVAWDSEGALPANWEERLHNCVGQST